MHVREALIDGVTAGLRTGDAGGRPGRDRDRRRDTAQRQRQHVGLPGSNRGREAQVRREQVPRRIPITVEQRVVRGNVQRIAARLHRHGQRADERRDEVGHAIRVRCRRKIEVRLHGDAAVRGVAERKRDRLRGRRDVLRAADAGRRRSRRNRQLNCRRRARHAVRRARAGRDALAASAAAREERCKRQGRNHFARRHLMYRIVQLK